MHDKFGLGKVVDVTGTGDMTKATVHFEGNNVNSLCLSLQNLKYYNYYLYKRLFLFRS